MFLSSLLRSLPRLGARCLSVTRAVPSTTFMANFPASFPASFAANSSIPTLQARPVDQVGGSILEQMPENVFENIADENTDSTMYMDSVLRKRRLKMKKHKLRKRRREQRSLKKRLGKI